MAPRSMYCRRSRRWCPPRAGPRRHPSAGDRRIARAARPGRPIGDIAAGAIGAEARPVRAILFDKTAATNWALGWHQDRTIVVRERREVPGFGPWTVKAGLLHVAPPFEVLAGMVSNRGFISTPWRRTMRHCSWRRALPVRTGCRGRYRCCGDRMRCRGMPGGWGRCLAVCHADPSRFGCCREARAASGSAGGLYGRDIAGRAGVAGV